MDIRRTSPTFLTALISLLAGCGEGITGPAPSRALSDPSSPVALLLPAVHQIRAQPQTVETPPGSELIVSIKGLLLSDGRARGFAFITPENGSIRFHLRFREWTSTCESGLPVVQLKGTGRAQGPGVLKEGEFTFTYTFGYDAPPADQRERPKVRWIWDSSDRAGEQGQHLVFEAARFVEPSHCSRG